MDLRSRAAGPLVLFAAVAALFCAAPASAQAIDPSLDALNKAARAAYASGRQALLARTDPVIIVEFDDLLLLRAGTEERAPFTPPVYHALKSVAHLPLGIFAVLAPAAEGGAAPETWRAVLETLRASAGAAVARLQSAGFSEVQQQRQRRIIDGSLAFIDRTLRAGSVSADGLRSYVQAMAPLTLANANDAALAQVDGLHAAFSRVKAALSAAELARLHVLVLGSKTPRQDNLQYTYFVNALGPGTAEKRVIYAEGIFDRERALGLLGTLVIDRRVGRDFYGDEARMERDLLGDAAAARIMQIFGRLGGD